MKIGIWIGDLMQPGLTVWREGEFEVIRYNVYGHNDGEYVFGVLDHYCPSRSKIVGFFNDEREAVDVAKSEEIFHDLP